MREVTNARPHHVRNLLGIHDRVGHWHCHSYMCPAVFDERISSWNKDSLWLFYLTGRCMSALEKDEQLKAPNPSTSWASETVDPAVYPPNDQLEPLPVW